MNNSFFPGWTACQPSNRRRLANFCHQSPAILSSRLRFMCATSSWDSGNTKFSL